LHAMLAGLMAGATPNQVRIAMVDPKRNEFSIWRDAPHILSIARSIQEATDLIGQLAQETKRRGDLMDRVPGVCKDLDTYNRKSGKHEPYIVCVIDECIGLLGESRALDDSIKTIAGLGRSAGVFLWMATQHGTAVAGLDRVIKVNLVTRFVFRVADADAARNAGCPGAELIRADQRGRMLAKLDEAPEGMQAFYLADDELEQVAAQVCGVKGADNNDNNEFRMERNEGCAPMAMAGERITEDEASLVFYAVHDLGGDFVVNKIAAEYHGDGWTSHRVKLLAQEWEKRGWLTHPASAAAARRVTARLCELAGIDFEVAQGVAQGAQGIAQGGAQVAQGGGPGAYEALFKPRMAAA